MKPNEPPMTPNLPDEDDEPLFENHMALLKEKLQDREYARGAYRSLCNVVWAHTATLPLGWKLQTREAEVRWRTLLEGPLMRLAFWLERRRWIAFGTVSRLQDWMGLEYPLDLFGEKLYSTTWRGAGGLVAEMRGQGEDYLDYYCDGGEGDFSTEFVTDMEMFGWEPFEYEDVLENPTLED